MLLRAMLQASVTSALHTWSRDNLGSGSLCVQMVGNGG